MHNAKEGAPVQRTGPEENAALVQIRDLIYGESKREMDDQLTYLIDRQRDFEDAARREMRKVVEDIRSVERRNEEARRALLKDLSKTVDEMAKSIAKLAE